MLDSLRCPHCLSEQIEEYSVYETKHNGSRKLSAILILAILPISGYEGAGSRWGMSVLAVGGRRTGTT